MEVAVHAGERSSRLTLCSVRWLCCAVLVCVFAGVSEWVPAKTASEDMLQINRYKHEETPIDNVFVSNEDEMTSLITGEAVTGLCGEVEASPCDKEHRHLAEAEKKSNKEPGKEVETTVEKYHAFDIHHRTDEPPKSCLIFDGLRQWQRSVRNILRCEISCTCTSKRATFCSFRVI
ncbi:hypothetical protein T12_6169 [Trichinella patagoniensis]|uniref:Uncharacterized protein n=1 Tax=Trichinella patagoniensis TaxID=990121 RepID=A0A0V1A9Y9_9BILA|nr:hypothetical protein T12_6169 [Trichinella patagoniensis]